MNPSEWDDTYLIVEPYTGAVFEAVEYLQSNYYYTPTMLFPEYERILNNETKEEDGHRMFPVSCAFRSGNVTS